MYRTPPTVEVVQTNRGGKSTYHAPGQLVSTRSSTSTATAGDVKRYVRDLEQALLKTLADARGRRRRGSKG